MDINLAKGYAEFVKIIDKADGLAQSLSRTNIPYYIFIDELEAYRDEGNTFYRDLRMIRDLLFTVKRMNDLFRSGTKLICSVRPEVLQAINRFVQPNQLHKIMQGYDEKLIWEHTNTNSFSHPIIGVLIKRIENAEAKNSQFPRKIMIHPALRIELAVNGRIDRYISRIERLEHDTKETATFSTTVKEIFDRYVIVSFAKDGSIQTGYIFMNNLGFGEVEEGSIGSMLHIGESIKAKSIGYANYLSCWIMNAEY